ncbi:hypothetical protein CEUSTIGMA_g12455.t1 [Chlamydomonas eustigma]|uniref:Uncharacterized protein n=1 Tax=Chlamydomonas eustigma TaxID=1157962 RepID=A0A250XPP4_9CHLO|nr:hypothetical protein CEUSTIGMA_g12455.t1 [Chlamydomonas eustigma]|eukprot:GAX85035.1 hypothetical protein CEUSTIGMA_g12455.t1 [Chlamydomonas eustigma]
MRRLLKAAVCGTSDALWPQREGDIYWSWCPTPPKGLPAIPIAPITEEQLQDWLSDTVGWHALEISADAIRAAGAHHTQAKALIQAALEAAARINTHRCRFTQVDFDQTLGRCLAAGLSAYPNLEVLALRELNVYDEAITHLSKGIQGSERLQKLSFNLVDISGSGWAALLRSLQGSSSADGGGSSSSTTVTYLKCKQCLVPSSVPAWSSALPALTTITHLELSGNVIGDWSLSRICEGCADILKALLSAPQLEVLKMRRCGVDDAGVECLCEAIRSGHGLRTVDLGGSRVSSSGAQLLGAVCSVNNKSGVRCKLRDLSLGGSCMLGTEGVSHFAQALEHPLCSLACLDLSDCEAGDAAAVALSAALATRHMEESSASSSSSRLNPSNAALSLLGGRAIEKPKTSRVMVLEKLHLSSNQFTMKGIASLISSLQYCEGLQLLDISFNWVGPCEVQSCVENMRKRMSWRATSTDTATPSSSFKNECRNESNGCTDSTSRGTSTRSVGGGGGGGGGEAAGVMNNVASTGHLEPHVAASINSTMLTQVRAEVLPEFRLVEKIKAGHWLEPAPVNRTSSGRMDTSTGRGRQQVAYSMPHNELESSFSETCKVSRHDTGETSETFFGRQELTNPPPWFRSTDARGGPPEALDSSVQGLTHPREGYAIPQGLQRSCSTAISDTPQSSRSSDGDELIERLSNSNSFLSCVRQMSSSSCNSSTSCDDDMDETGYRAEIITSADPSSMIQQRASSSGYDVTSCGTMIAASHQASAMLTTDPADACNIKSSHSAVVGGYCNSSTNQRVVLDARSTHCTAFSKKPPPRLGGTTTMEGWPVAGVTASSGGGPGSRRLQRELEGCESLVDGTFNMKLPVSFPAASSGPIISADSNIADRQLFAVEATHYADDEQPIAADGALTEASLIDTSMNPFSPSLYNALDRSRAASTRHFNNPFS